MAKLSENPAPEGDELARITRDSMTASVRLTSLPALYEQQRKQTLWLAALLTSALAAVLAGFWLLRRSLAREQQLGQMKSNFVASVSHELRAPIASMRVMAENLESGLVQEDSRRTEYHRLISEECRRLSSLIDNVLDFARIEQNRKSYHFAETEIHALVQDAISLMQARASQRQQKITSQLELIEPPPLCDGAAIQQALINLLDNAIKFSAAGLEILVRVRKGSADTWELAVVDQGVGIARAEHLRIFERFYRVGSELCRETQGAGIGLSIVQHVAAGHCGSVAVESEPGAGATFTLSLPLNPERK
jgi:signal transduction histidine kinase